METLSGHAFLSYVREDSASVDILQRTLEAAAIPVWRDTADLWPGEDWRVKIRHAISLNALVFIACFSSRSVAREKSYQNEELLLAIEQLRLRRPHNPWLIPIRFDDCEIPDLDLGGGRTLGSIQRSDLFGDSQARTATRLVEAIQRILGQRSAPSNAREQWDRPTPTVERSGKERGVTIATYATDDDLSARAGIKPDRFSASIPELLNHPTRSTSTSITEIVPKFSQKDTPVIEGEGSKVLELEFSAGTYRMSWTTEGKGLFVVRHESGRDGKGLLVTSVAAPNPSSGEQLVRIPESGCQIFSIEAPKLSWVLVFASLIIQDFSPRAAILGKEEDAETGRHVSPVPNATRAFMRKLQQFRQCADQLTILTTSYTKCLNEATVQTRKAVTPRQKLSLLENLAEDIEPIIERYSVQAITLQDLVREVDQETRTLLAEIKAISPNNWDEGTQAYLRSTRRLSESGLARTDASQRMYRANRQLEGKSIKLDRPLQRLQSALRSTLSNGDIYEAWLKELKDLGY